MNDQLSYLQERLDQIADLLREQAITLARNTDSLEEHMRRTNLLEEQMELALWPIRIAKVMMWAGGLITFGATLYYYWNQTRGS